MAASGGGAEEEAYAGHAVGHFDDGLVLPEVPHHAAVGEGGGKDVLDFAVPRQAQDVFRRLKAELRREGRRRGGRSELEGAIGRLRSESGDHFRLAITRDELRCDRMRSNPGVTVNFAPSFFPPTSINKSPK